MGFPGSFFAVQENQVWSLGRENPLEKGLATHSSSLGWRILWTEEPGGLKFLGSQRIGLQANKEKMHSWWREQNKFEKFREKTLAWRQATTNPSLLSIYIVASSGHLTYGIENCVVFCDCLFPSVQSLSLVRLFETPWITACQASLSIANSQSLLKLMSIEPVMPSSHLILCSPLILLPPNPPSIRVFFNESTLHMRWPKYWSFSLPTDLGSSSFSILSFCLFILFLGFSRQEYWSGLPFLSPVDHILSELSTMTHPTWVAPHGMA